METKLELAIVALAGLTLLTLFALSIAKFSGKRYETSERERGDED